MKKYTDNLEQKGGKDVKGYYAPYYLINPQIISPVLYKQNTCLEFERLLITKHRSGSNNLKIQTGRLRNIPRDSRICDCETALQTLEHVLCNCSLLEHARHLHNFLNSSMTGVMNTDDYSRLAAFLKSIEKALDFNKFYWIEPIYGLNYSDILCTISQISVPKFDQ